MFFKFEIKTLTRGCDFWTNSIEYEGELVDVGDVVLGH